MPIWPEVTPEKADLFNKYGRGIVHMGLHIGTQGFVYDRQRRRKRIVTPRFIELTSWEKRLNAVEEVIRRESVDLVTHEKHARTGPASLTFNGSGDDWQYLYAGDFTVKLFGPAFVEIFYFWNMGAETAPIKIALEIDGVVDVMNHVRVWFHLAYSPRIYKAILHCNPGKGEHRIRGMVTIAQAVTPGISPAVSSTKITTVRWSEDD